MILYHIHRTTGLLCSGCGLKAAFGKNKLLVTYPPLLKQLYPGHIMTGLTLYGRLVSKKVIVNVTPNLFHDEKVWQLHAVRRKRAALLQLPFRCSTALLNLRAAGRLRRRL